MSIEALSRRTETQQPWRSHRLLLVLTLLGLMGAAATGTAVAQPPADTQLPDLIGEVTLFGEEEFTVQAATKTEIPISKAPGAITVISAQQIRESGARTIPEVLRLVAGVNVRWNPMVQTVDIRSFGQNPFTSRALLLIDGVPYNSWNKGGFPQHPGFDFFVLQNIKRIEIVRGPGSSLYGENAYWGVINIISLGGEDLQGGRLELFGGDLEAQSLGLIYGQKAGEHGSYVISAKVGNGQFPTAFWFEENDAEVEFSDIYIKGKYKNWQFSYYRHEDEADGFSEPLIVPGLPPAVFQSVPSVDQTIDIAGLKYDKRWDPANISFGFDLSYAQRNGSHCTACHGSSERPEFADTDKDHGFQTIGDFRLGLHDLGANDLLIGIEVRQVDAGDHTEELTHSEEGFEPVFDYTKLAAYVQDIISLNNDRLRIILGARYDGSTDLFDDEVSPRVALVYSPTDPLVLRAGWSTAFRFPSFSELYQDSWFLGLDTQFFSFPLAVFAPNPNLDREEIRTFELGFEYRINPSLSTKVDLFHSELKDFIVMGFGFLPPPAPAFIRFENHPDDATTYGGEVELRYNAGRKVTGFVNYSYQDWDQDGDLRDSTNKPFEFVYSPQHKANLGAYFGPWSGVRFTLESQWRDNFSFPSSWNAVRTNFQDPTLGTEKGYTLVNVRVSYDVPVRIGSAPQGLRLSLYGKNLTDEKPEETITGISGELAGTSYFGSLEVRF